MFCKRIFGFNVGIHARTVFVLSCRNEDIMTSHHLSVIFDFSGYNSGDCSIFREQDIGQRLRVLLLRIF